jgi:hypothetical protein
MNRQLLACVAVFGMSAPLAANPTAYIINGRNIYTSTDGGVTFNNTGTVSVFNGANNIVGLGYHAGSNTFYATATDNNLYTVSGINTATATLSLVTNLGAGAQPISFEFFGDTFRGAKGSTIIELDLNNIGAGTTTVNAATGVAGTPSTGRIGSDYYGMTGAGNVVKFNIPGPGSVALGASGLGNVSVAGGSGHNGVYYTSAGYSNTDDIVFGTIDLTSGLFTQISTFNVGSLVGTMGMTVVDGRIIPLPTGAALAIVGVGMIAVRRRR